MLNDINSRIGSPVHKKRAFRGRRPETPLITGRNAENYFFGVSTVTGFIVLLSFFSSGFLSSAFLTSEEVVGLTAGAFGSTVGVAVGLTVDTGLTDAIGAGVVVGLTGAVLIAGSLHAPKTAAETARTVDKTKLLIVIFLYKN